MSRALSSTRACCLQAPRAAHVCAAYARATQLMATASPAEAAALSRLETAGLRGDVVYLASELSASPDSALVSARCASLLVTALHDERALAAASLAGVVQLMLETLRRHGTCGDVVAHAWLVVCTLVCHTEALVAPAVEDGALELALATLRNTTFPSCQNASSLIALVTLTCHHATSNHVARAVQLGAVEVRILLFYLLIFC